MGSSCRCGDFSKSLGLCSTIRWHLSLAVLAGLTAKFVGESSNTITGIADWGWEQELVAVTYFEFVTVLDGRRFKVIFKQLAEVWRMFWILILFWRQAGQGNQLLYDGTPAED